MFIIQLMQYFVFHRLYSIGQKKVFLGLLCLNFVLGGLKDSHCWRRTRSILLLFNSSLVLKNFYDLVCYNSTSVRCILYLLQLAPYLNYIKRSSSRNSFGSDPFSHVDNFYPSIFLQWNVPLFLLEKLKLLSCLLLTYLSTQTIAKNVEISLHLATSILTNHDLCCRIRNLCAIHLRSQ